MYKSILVLIALLLVSRVYAGSETGGGTGGEPAVITGPSHGTRDNMNEVITQGEMECLIKNMDDGQSNATEAASAFAKALKTINFDTSKMTTTCMLQVMAQVQVESTFKPIEQKGQAFEKTGWGYIQITGTDNLDAVAKCMNACDPGSGNGVTTNPQACLITNVPGADPDRAYKSALASLCWVKPALIDNQDHNRFCRDPGDNKEVSKIVNGQGASAETIQNRSDAFYKLKQLHDGLCDPSKFQH